MEIIQTDKAPKAIGPYSQGIGVNNMIFFSGQIPLNPESMKVETTTIEEQTRQVLTNVQGLLDSAGLSVTNVVKTTVFLQDMAEFPRMNGVYAEFFGEHRPARSTVQVARLPLDVKVEIECIAVRS